LNHTIFGCWQAPGAHSYIYTRIVYLFRCWFSNRRSTQYKPSRARNPHLTSSKLNLNTRENKPCSKLRAPGYRFVTYSKEYVIHYIVYCIHYIVYCILYIVYIILYSIYCACNDCVPPADYTSKLYQADGAGSALPPGRHS